MTYFGDIFKPLATLPALSTIPLISPSTPNFLSLSCGFPLHTTLLFLYDLRSVISLLCYGFTAKSKAHREGKGDALTGSSQVRAGEGHKVAAHIPLWFYSPSSTAAHTHGPEKGGENGTVSVSQTQWYWWRLFHGKGEKHTRTKHNHGTPQNTTQQLNWMVHEETVGYKQHWRCFLSCWNLSHV